MDIYRVVGGKSSPASHLMKLYNFRPLPKTFSLKNLADASFRAFGPAKLNPHGETVRETMGVWFTRYDLRSGVYNCEQ